MTSDRHSSRGGPRTDSNRLMIHYKTVGIFTNSIEESTMKLLLLLLVAGLVLSVEARAKGPKRPVESEEEPDVDAAEEAPEAEDDSDGDDGEPEAKSDGGASCAKKLSIRDQYKVAKATELTCYELLMEILVKRYGGVIRRHIPFWKTSYPTKDLRKAIRELPNAPCAKEDKIIDFGVGFVRGKY
ncbi:hypothetical protein PRIPAC_87233 [Pristionchus pacificus]|uniref:Uncharacterized protein n=1 Tax=Pristionchus pacificus TaxID=54126 RepID=A0A2A6B7T9_PRIPA|nr:hypothetical protein PRIPAC_87233 [Pristionchus pacificus]|eukprot:PDM61936.1 hypothetical protein PRIPAC_51378 [Pristionchus pacificus]